MKKLFTLFSILLLGLFLFGCTAEQPVTEQQTPVVDAPDLESPELNEVGDDLVNISQELNELDISNEELDALVE